MFGKPYWMYGWIDDRWMENQLQFCHSTILYNHWTRLASSVWKPHVFHDSLQQQAFIVISSGPSPPLLHCTFLSFSTLMPTGTGVWTHRRSHVHGHTLTTNPLIRASSISSVIVSSYLFHWSVLSEPLSSGLFGIMLQVWPASRLAKQASFRRY